MAHEFGCQPTTPVIGGMCDVRAGRALSTIVPHGCFRRAAAIW
ncbi:hypothetical protein OEM_19730 [Mycobacterium intracellulare subsp. yongonense 05-1390]|uniref:Uncharacterized protein n=1 Tax=Mycobacterium intracellulare (strain ATCC 13950 / DSM 43223 / JCM 6384 / NCTC 13025 / 3600) TaxID=487521 RepID=H8IUW4_MYCIA|nr:hypothetical protein OCU_22020 [Mycobacterium intracellulare ATCC 13950]AGP63508.1 hypothetical protein OEM_19730 [Mycobacterium intracellulare subsp. yongonense 05-1390]ETZ36683.1 hypothetical protein L843_2435 [Mycobacterium intracellulare MIN_061107_1834]